MRAHLAGTIAIDFLVLPTVRFHLLYVFFVLFPERRRLLHVNVTSHPHQFWTAQQIVEAVGAYPRIASCGEWHRSTVEGGPVHD